MKYFKRLGLYKASNLTFNPNSLDAHSYQWWRFVARIDGKVIFNSFRYSPSTGKHQRKVRSLLESLGIKIDIDMPLRKGIDSRPLNELILEGEETLCDQFLKEESKKIDRAEKSKKQREDKKREESRLIEVSLNGDAMTNFDRESTQGFSCTGLDTYTKVMTRKELNEFLVGNTSHTRGEKIYDNDPYFGQEPWGKITNKENV